MYPGYYEPGSVPCRLSRIITVFFSPEHLALRDVCIRAFLWDFDSLFFMVLEESLVFYDDDDANEFIQFLKKNGCRATKKHESFIAEEILMNGPIGNIIAMLEDITAQERDTETESQAGAEELLTSLLSGLSAGEKISLRKMKVLLLTNLKLTRDFIADIMARFNEGDLIYPKEFIEGIKDEMRSSIDKNREKELNATIIEKMPFFSHLGVMTDNGLIGSGPSGITLAKKMAPDEVLVERRVFDPDAFDDETLGKHNISLNRNIIFETQTRVVIEPAFYFTCDTDDVDAILSDLEVDEKSLDSLMFNHFHKSLAIENIIEIIKKARKISLKEIIQQMDTFVPDYEDDEYLLTAHATPEFTAGIINDMRKARIIEGNDDKIRLARL
jgi:hypothetical protein